MLQCKILETRTCLSLEMCRKSKAVPSEEMIGEKRSFRLKNLIIPLPKKLLTIFTLSPKLTNSENGENVRFVLFFGITNNQYTDTNTNCIYLALSF